MLEAAEHEGMVPVLVDLQDVRSIAEIVVRIERAYERLKGPIRRTVENLFRTWNIGLSLGVAALPRRFSATQVPIPSRSCSVFSSCRARYLIVTALPA